MADIGADSTAIAWVIAKNKERDDSFKQQKSLYRKGVTNGNKGNNSGELSEDVTFPSDDPLFEFGDPSGFDDEDPSPYATDPGIFDMSKGIWFKFAAKDRPDLWRATHIFIERYSYDRWVTSTWHSVAKDYPRVVTIDQTGKVLTDWRLGVSGTGKPVYVYERDFIYEDDNYRDEWRKIYKYRLNIRSRSVEGFSEYYYYQVTGGTTYGPEHYSGWNCRCDFNVQGIIDEDGQEHELVYAGASTEDPGKIT